MVVGKRERTDIDFDQSAGLYYNGNLYRNNNVYGDRTDIKRRDVFPKDKMREDYPRLPKKVKAFWQGKIYPAKLTFRYATGGRGPVPVYSFKLGTARGKVPKRWRK